MIIIVIGSVIAIGLLISYFGIPFFRKPELYRATVLTKDETKDDWNGSTWGSFVGNRVYVRAGNPRRVTFHLGNDKSIVLIVPNKIYEKISIGSVGMLEVDGTRFKKFTI